MRRWLAAHPTHIDIAITPETWVMFIGVVLIPLVLLVGLNSPLLTGLYCLGVVLGFFGYELSGRNRP